MLSIVEKHDPRVRRTQQLLQQAFLDLLMLKSFEKLTVKDITERAMVNRATFYAHFDNKYVLLNATISASFMHILQQRLPTGAVASLTDLEQIVLAVCDFQCQFDGACRRMERRFEVLVENEVKALVANLLQKWFARVNTQQLLKGATPELAAIMASWAIYGAVLHWSRQHPRQPVEHIAQMVLLLISGEMPLVSIEPIP